MGFISSSGTAGVGGGGTVSGWAQASGFYVEHSGGLYQASGVYVGVSGGLFQTSGQYVTHSGGMYQRSGIYPLSGLFALSGVASGSFVHAATFLGSGNNTTILYTLSHGLLAAPTGISVLPASPQARGDIDVSGNASGIFVSYTSPPLSGNVRLSWIAGPSSVAGLASGVYQLSGAFLLSGVFALSGATGAGGVSGVVHACRVCWLWK